MSGESETIDDGGPAFPEPSVAVGNDLHYGSRGMSLLDYFAGQALANSVIAHSNLIVEDKAHQCYRQAIAMLNERERINAATH